ncbi:MAG: dTDP-4-dehydrorhamnose 3,5-epimerase family protein [Planctomycetes bacterium]|nr:dTDP-4-dehydrorhamnose 3,5-epimerase family protein [Planctomycetota bacterium]
MNAADPLPIPVFNGSIKDAYTRAIEAVEPVLVTVSVHTDDRGWSYMNLFQGVMSPQGQANYSVQHPGVIKAWHRHRDQTDFWLCVSGHIKVGVHRDDDTSWMAVVGEKRPGVVVIPPPLWHGAATVGHVPAGLLYYVTHAYDPAHPDEERRAFDSVPGFPWHAQHR